MSVRAKFKVNSIETIDQPKSVRQEDGSYKTEPGTMTTLKMSPTFSNDPNSENKKFWDASPGGQLTLNCVNTAAVEQFKIGQEFYLDFTPME